jgi:transcriptional regulator with PAS, ATPase and Fis domain
MNFNFHDDVIYKSKDMEDIVALAEKIAGSDATVLIQGESGVGKDIIAKLIHRCSLRKDKPFIKINCASIPENLMESELFGYEKGAFTGASENGKSGIFELANGGVLFLDEVGTIPIYLQPKLLRAIQEKEIIRVGGASYTPLDIRIIAATNIDLKAAIRNNTFREDLFYRLNVVPIMIPPLRKRKDDICPLAEHFLKVFNKKYNTTKKMDDQAMGALLHYRWPGNVRELENIVERLVITSRSDIITSLEVTNQFSEVDTEDLFFEDNLPQGLKGAVDRYEKKLIIENMKYYSRSQELADALKINKSTLTRKMKKYGIRNIYTED